MRSQRGMEQTARRDWALGRHGAHGSRDLELSQSSCSKLVDECPPNRSKLPFRAEVPFALRLRCFCSGRFSAARHKWAPVEAVSPVLPVL